MNPTVRHCCALPGAWGTWLVAGGTAFVLRVMGFLPTGRPPAPLMIRGPWQRASRQNITPASCFLGPVTIVVSRGLIERATCSAPPLLISWRHFLRDWMNLYGVVRAPGTGDRGCRLPSCAPFGQLAT